MAVCVARKLGFGFGLLRLGFVAYLGFWLSDGSLL